MTRCYVIMSVDNRSLLLLVIVARFNVYVVRDGKFQLVFLVL